MSGGIWGSGKRVKGVWNFTCCSYVFTPLQGKSNLIFISYFLPLVLESPFSSLSFCSYCRLAEASKCAGNTVVPAPTLAYFLTYLPPPTAVLRSTLPPALFVCSRAAFNYSSQSTVAFETSNIFYYVLHYQTSFHISPQVLKSIAACNICNVAPGRHRAQPYNAVYVLSPKLGAFLVLS